MHELATNAAKYGSLSAAAGTVTLSWMMNRGNKPPTLKIVWQESGSPPVREPATKGLGSTLIDSVIHGAQVRREFLPGGLLCTIEFPLPEADGNAFERV